MKIRIIGPAAPVFTGLSLLAVVAVAVRAADDIGRTASGSRLQSVLESGLFAGGQTDQLVWAEGNARADAALIYVEGGLDLVWRQASDRPGPRAGLVVSVDMGGESGHRPALGFGPRLTWYADETWAVQAQAGLLAGRGGSEESANHLGSERYSFKDGRQMRFGLLYRSKVSAVLMARTLRYEAELLPMQSPGQPFQPRLYRRDTAHLLCVGVMVHGRVGTYAALGSLLCMGVLTVLGSLAAAGA